MKKMPPLPTKKTGANIAQLGMQVVSNKIKMPPRYNSIERVIRQTRKQFSEESVEMKLQSDKPSHRENALMKRPMSAKQSSRQIVTLSNDAKRSRESKDSLNSKGSSYRNRQSPHYSRKMRMTMPSITSHSWVLYEMKEERFIYGKSNFKKREIASLTKIMNLYTILYILEERNLVAGKIRINVSKEACMLTGTTAELKAGIEVSLQDLFYGMMLPSGNDAAYQVAQVGGAIIWAYREAEMERSVVHSCQRLSKLASQNQSVVGLFIHEMNQLSRKLGLSRSYWVNPHGLSNINNFSTAEDVAKLCMRAMKNTQFREVVSTPSYNCAYYYEQALDNGGSQILKGCLKWENTNKMLAQGWSGIKTGITPNAGPCLAASCRQVIRGREYEFLVVLVKSQSMEERWREARELVEWITSDSSYGQK